MKALLLAGGSGTRLYPITWAVCKQLLPVYDKPMIYYPLSVIMLAGIRDILIISSPHDSQKFKDIIGDGSKIGLNISYAEQIYPNGIAEAFLIGKNFIGDEDVCLILGDNIFYGHGFIDLLRQTVQSIEMKGGAALFGYYINDPKRYGIIEFDKEGKIVSIEEKPDEPKSNCAVTGLYFYDNRVVKIAETLKPSGRSELEITDVNREYLKCGNLRVRLLGRGYAWFDAGTHDSLLEASEFIATIEKRQGLKIACIEEIAYRFGYINAERMIEIIDQYNGNDYGKYLLDVLRLPPDQKMYTIA